MIEIDRFFVEHPELRKFFYDSEPISKDDPKDTPKDTPKEIVTETMWDVPRADLKNQNQNQH